MRQTVFAIALLICRAASGELAVSLVPSQPSPAPLGTLVRWTAAVAEPEERPLRYRFRLRENSGEFRTVVDYGPRDHFDWAPASAEGSWEIEASVRDLRSGEEATQVSLYAISPRVRAEEPPAVSPTRHPLVFLYSAAPCAAGSRMRVRLTAPESTSGFTPWKRCDGRSMNFYLAGMRPETAYTAQHVVETGGVSLPGPVLPVNSGRLPLLLSPYSVLTPAQAIRPEGVILQGTLFEWTIGVNLRGEVVWYYDGDLSFLTRPVAGGTFLGIHEEPTEDQSRQVVREFDLAGFTLAETNAERVNEQLEALGLRSITSFHHEAVRLPDGRLLVLAASEQILHNVQGPGPVNVIGDTILVLDKDLQVTWVWDSFDHMDPRRMATLGETCRPLQGGCPPFYLTQIANDWLHGNSVQFTRTGDLIFSIRHQDWVIRIDYNYGNGDGRVLWRLGKDGDFRLAEGDWFSHQHDAALAEDDMTLSLFDNGNLRAAQDPSATSRGLVLQLDESNRVARISLNADMGSYSSALGSAQPLPNGNYFFGNGWVREGPIFRANAVEVTTQGAVVYNQQVDTPVYRSIRMRDLYTTW